MQAKNNMMLCCFFLLPGQPGVQHVNLQPLYYVCFVLDKLGFNYDEAQSKLLRKQASLIHLQHNIAVFKRHPRAHMNLANL